MYNFGKNSHIRIKLLVIGGDCKMNKKRKTQVIPILIGLIAAYPSSIIARNYGFTFLPRVLMTIAIALVLWAAFRLVSGNWNNGGQRG